MHAYLHWLEDRGIRHPVSAKVVTTAVIAAPKVETRVRVAFISDTPIEGEEATLLHKMIQAMRLHDDEVLVADCQSDLTTLLNARRPEIVVALGTSAAHVLRDSEHSLVTIFHPRELILAPALKRQAWADLQGIMGRLGLA